MTLVQSVRRTVTIVGFPLSAEFALRMWAAMVVGLYAAFWLQPSGAPGRAESTSSASTLT
jgi:hypothetical protein